MRSHYATGLAAALALASACLAGGQALAQAEAGALLTGTLKTIAARGTILIGHREGAVPFSFLNGGKQPVGFSVDVCRGIASDVAAKLGRDLVEPGAPDWQTGVRIVFVPLKADERLPKVMSGAVDLECGSTTANAERAKSVAFSPITFLAGTKLMVPAAVTSGDKPILSYRDLAGKRVVVSTGTTNADAIKRLGSQLQPPLQVVETPSTDAAYERLLAGQADAFASDDILLYGLIALHSDGARFKVIGDYLSFEPYAITFRRDDPAFADLIRASFERQAAEGRLAASYRRWFTDKLPSGDNLNLPMSPQLSEMFRALGQPD